MKTRALLLLALPALALSVASCRDNRASIQLQSVCFPSKDCTMSATCDKVATGLAKLDVATTSSFDFELWIQVSNTLPSNGDPAAGRVNTNDAHIDEITVEYEGLSLPAWTYNPTSQRVPANGATTVAVKVISGQNGATASLLAAAVPTSASPGRPLTANVRFRGYLDDGSRFETGEFPTGLEVCNGCVRGCPSATIACPIAGMDPHSCATTQ